MKRLHTQDALRILRGLEALLNYYLPAIFVVGHLVRSCTWAGRADGSTGIVATCARQRRVECKEKVAQRDATILAALDGCGLLPNPNPKKLTVDVIHRVGREDFTEKNRLRAPVLWTQKTVYVHGFFLRKP